MQLLDVVELEQRMGGKVSRHVWRYFIRQGRIPAIRVGRRVLVTEEALADFLQSHPWAPAGRAGVARANRRRWATRRLQRAAKRLERKATSGALPSPSAATFRHSLARLERGGHS
jgi:excisionase family DNA binding protein